MAGKPTPSEGVKGDGKGKTDSQSLWRHYGNSTPSKGVAETRGKPTPSEGVRWDGKGKTDSQSLWRHRGYSTPSEGVRETHENATPSEGVTMKKEKERKELL